MTPQGIVTDPAERAVRTKDLRVGRLGLKAAVGANLSLAATYLAAAELYRPGWRDALAVITFFLFVALAVVALVAGAASWRTQVGRLGLLIVLSTLPFCAVALLQQRYLDVYPGVNYSRGSWPFFTQHPARVRYIDRVRTVTVPAAPVVVSTPAPPSLAPANGSAPPLPPQSSVGATAAAVYFSPRGGCTDAIVREIAAARQTIRVQAAYGVTSKPIAAALLDAHKRGVDVKAILDRSEQKDKYTSATFLYNAGIQTLIDFDHTIAHNKIIVVDGAVVLTGSFNFSKAAEERNAENLLVLRDTNLAARYGENWQAHAQHARAYVPPAGSPSVNGAAR